MRGLYLFGGVWGLYFGGVRGVGASFILRGVGATFIWRGVGCGGYIYSGYIYQCSPQRTFELNMCNTRI